ncbi:MAG: hypothetical protein ACR2RF_16770 [Geminicoccaceae bacterium]
MRWLDAVDRVVLEPIVRRRFPEPVDRHIAAITVHSGQGNMRFLCLPGAFCLDAPSNWAGWIRSLRCEFPTAEIVVLNGFYYYWVSEKYLIEKIIDLGRSVLADRMPTYIVAFSFGGLLAKRIVVPPSEHEVRAVITMATEHRGHLPRIADMRDVSLSVPLDIDLPLYTFGGLLDPIVWPWTAYTDRSCHRTLTAGHFSFMRSARTRQVVMAHLRDIIAGRRQAR